MLSTKLGEISVSYRQEYRKRENNYIEFNVIYILNYYNKVPLYRVMGMIQIRKIKPNQLKDLEITSQLL